MIRARASSNRPGLPAVVAVETAADGSAVSSSEPSAELSSAIWERPNPIPAPAIPASAITKVDLPNPPRDRRGLATGGRGGDALSARLRRCRHIGRF